MVRVFMLARLLLIGSVVACSVPMDTTQSTVDDRRYRPKQGGLVRTNVEYWEYRKLPLSGVKLELPLDVFYVADLPGRVTVMMNPLYPPRSMYAEPECLVQIQMYRKDEDEKRVDREVALGNAHYHDPVDQEYTRWYHAEHRTVDQFDEGAYSYFRLDVDCGDGTIVMAKVELRNSIGDGEQPHLKEDGKAISRILASVGCFEPVQKEEWEKE